MQKYEQVKEKNILINIIELCMNWKFNTEGIINIIMLPETLYKATYSDTLYGWKI